MLQQIQSKNTSDTTDPNVGGLLAKMILFLVVWLRVAKQLRPTDEGDEHAPST